MEAFPKIPEPVILEHQLAEVMQDQKRTGWPFDIQKAQELENKLLNRLEELRVATETVCTFVPGNIFIPKRDNKKQGYIKDAPMQRLKDFNPSSREHIAWWFKTFQGWEPNKLTPTGKAVIDETVLKEIGSKEALIFLEILVTQKKLGMLSQGQNAWLKLVKNGRLHHSCFIGAATHRMAHSHPNLAQVSSDKDCRELFITKPGWKLVDSDLAGIELRMFAHYLHRYDGGRYADVLLNGDIHQENADKIGISRRLVKTVTYAFLYGAGNQKIGLSYDPMLSKDKASKKGAEIRKAYLDAIPGLEKLVTDVAKRVEDTGSIRAIDGRILSVDKPHKALNFLLQGSAGVLAKRWILITNNTLTQYGIEHARYAFVHDEQVLGAPPSSADQVAGVCKLSAMEAGEYYNLRLVIEADANIGNNWSEVH
jgi:DNA polymerase I-like protein with 3'-5' exonuclease and polymerase domains